ncbi:hypothetical protein SODG_001148 [Sodalis praecaptivus]
MVPHGITVDKDKDVQKAIEKFHPMREAARLVEQHFNALRNTYIMLEENALSLYRKTFAFDIVDPQGNHIPLSQGNQLSISKPMSKCCLSFTTLITLRPE